MIMLRTEASRNAPKWCGKENKRQQQQQKRRNIENGNSFLFNVIFLTFTESGERRSSSDAVEDETGDSDDFDGRPMRFFAVDDVDPLALLWCADCDIPGDVCVDGTLFSVIGGTL